MSSSSSSVHATIPSQLSISSNNQHAADTNSNASGVIVSILNSRKCWRSMKGADEVVWPPELEAALIEGLEKYQPSESKSGRPMGRFPMRNKFVSDYILKTTGKRRTPKQVGSRIQQLRDTDTGKPILKAISDKHYAMMHPQGGACKQSKETSSTDSSSSQSQADCNPPIPVMQPNHFYVEVLPPYLSWPSPMSSIMAPAEGGRTLSSMDPTVAFTAPGNTACLSRFHVYKNGVLIHQEIGGVDVSPYESNSVNATRTYLYTTSLIPQYWARLCEVEDPSSYVIQVEVVSVVAASHTSPDVLHSSFYHFVTPSLTTMTPPLSPHSSNGDSDADFTLFSTEALQKIPQQRDSDTFLDNLLTPEIRALSYTVSQDVTQMELGWYSASPICDPAAQDFGKTACQPSALGSSSGSPSSSHSPVSFDFDFSSFDFELSKYLDDFSYQ